MIGKKLAHYEILQMIGSGGMGEVWRARDTRLDRDVALKLLPAEMGTDPDRLERFSREAKTVAGLNHPHIVTLYSVEEVDGVRFLTMELVEGKSLAETIRPGGLSAGEVLDLGVAIAEAVAAAHEKGVVHRDLKPGNVMISSQGRVKVLDFGLAKPTATASVGADDATGIMPLTTVGAVVGTVPYMSPEQLRGQALGPESDVFSFGILLYEVATGFRPFEGPTNADVTSSILTATPTSLTAVKPDLPDRLGRIVAQCLEKDPADRFESAREVRDELRALQREMAAEGATSPTRRRSSAASDRRRALPVVIAIAILSVIVAAGYFLRRADDALAGAKTIAVLPFENVSPDEANAYFATGVHEDVMTRLAGLRDLRVISKTSVVSVQREAGTVVEIGRRLGAAYVVEGSVRRAEGQVRVTAKLIDAKSDQTLWSESYQRELANSLELQSEIAQEIVRALGTRVSPIEQDGLETVPTVAIAAYDSYLAAHKIISNPGSTYEDLRRAVDHLEQATAIDPSFLDGWGLLSETYTDCARSLAGLDGREAEVEAALDNAGAALDRAVALDPRSASTLRAEGYLLETSGDRAGAVRAYDRALEARPNDTMILQFQSMLYLDLGQADKALECVERAYVLDNNNRRVIYGLTFLYEATGRYADMVPFLRRLHELNPLATHLEVQIAYYQFLADGSLDSYRAFEHAIATVERTEKCDIRSIQDLELNAAILRDDFDQYAAAWEGKWDRHHAGHGNWSCPGQINDEANHARLLRGFQRDALADSIIARAQASSMRPYNDRAVCMFNRVSYQPKLDYLSGNEDLARQEIDRAIAETMNVEAFPRGAVERQVLLETVDLVDPERVYGVYRQVVDHPKSLTRMEVICANPWTFPNLLRDDRFVAEVRTDGRFVEFLEHFGLLGDTAGS